MMGVSKVGHRFGHLLLAMSIAGALSGCAAVPAAILAGAQLSGSNEIGQKAKGMNCRQLAREWRLASDVGLISPKSIYAREIRNKQCRI